MTDCCVGGCTVCLCSRPSFFFKRKTAYEMRISDWSSDVCSSDLIVYCESGFGPERPWGLVHLGGQHMSMGDDSGWFPIFLDAYFGSFAPTIGRASCRERVCQYV